MKRARDSTRPKMSYERQLTSSSIVCPICKETLFQRENAKRTAVTTLRLHKLRSKKCIEIRKNLYIASDEDHDEDNDGDMEEEVDQDEEHGREEDEDRDEGDANDDGEAASWNGNHDEVPSPAAWNDAYIFDEEGIFSKQKILMALFDEGEIVHSFKKLRTFKGNEKTDWRDLFTLYKLAQRLGAGRVEGKKILSSFFELIERHGLEKAISLRKDWRSVQRPFESTYDDLFKARRIEYPLPREFFGTKTLDGRKPIAPMVGIALDIKAVLAEALLDIDIENFSTSFERKDGILGGYGTGDDFHNILEYVNEMEEHPIYGKPIPLCIGISSDKTHCNHSGSVCEQAVVASILNAKGGAYKMLFTGFVPLQFPYSDHVLHSLMCKQGNTVIQLATLNAYRKRLSKGLPKTLI